MSCSLEQLWTGEGDKNGFGPASCELEKAPAWNSGVGRRAGRDLAWMAAAVDR